MPLILTHTDLLARGITLSKHRLWVLEQRGMFPRRVNVSAGRIGWIAEEIDNYIARVAAREIAPASAARPRSPGRPRKSADAVVAA